nr:SDR family NAD(P)-dependent oxidoreductase [Pseudomonadota bacterium]
MTNSSSKTALVTGASRGIGAATLAALGQAGYRVIGTATSAAGVAAIEQASADYGGVGVLYNASEREQATALATSAAVEASAGVDVLVINAGITADSLLLRMKEDDWTKVLEVNLTSVFLLSQAMIRAMMKKRWGRIIIISSVVASTGNAGQANYCAAKAGLE